MHLKKVKYEHTSEEWVQNHMQYKELWEYWAHRKQEVFPLAEVWLESSISAGIKVMEVILRYHQSLGGQQNRKVLETW